MKNEPLRCPLSEDVFYVFKDSEGHLVNLSYENDCHYIEITKETNQSDHSFIPQTILCFSNVEDAFFMKEKLIELYPELLEQVSALTITWLMASDMENESFSFDYYLDACY